MREVPIGDDGIAGRGMKAVIVAQFCSAFGDNALLFATLALLQTLHFPLWSQPALQIAFVAAYIVCAPFVGRLADGFCQGTGDDAGQWPKAAGGAADLSRR